MSGQFRSFMDEQMAADPIFAEEVRCSEGRLRDMVERTCSEGNCVEFYDPRTGTTESGWGPVGCPCSDDCPSSQPLPITSRLFDPAGA